MAAAWAECTEKIKDLRRPASSAQGRMPLGIATVGGSMSEAANAIRMPPISSGAKLKGRARGALICAASGSARMFWAATFAPTARNAWLALITVMTVLIGGRAVTHVQRARRYASSVADRERWASIAILFWIDTAAEWVLSASGCRDRAGALPPLLADTAVPRGHYRIAFSPSREAIECCEPGRAELNYPSKCVLGFAQRGHY